MPGKTRPDLSAGHSIHRRAEGDDMSTLFQAVPRSNRRGAEVTLDALTSNLFRSLQRCNRFMPAVK